MQDNSVDDSGLVYPEESYKIMGACFEVYKEKGCGFSEGVYQDCLAIELGDRDIPFIEKPQIQLDYKQRKIKHMYEPDMICYNKIILELKAVKHLTDEHRAQIINYLKSTKLQLGLLLNFGHYPKLEYERFINKSL